MTVRKARAGEADVVTRLIATAFHAIPPTGWLIPDPDVRRERFVPYMRIFVDHGFAEGAVDVVVDERDEPVAASIWWSSPVPDPPGYEARLADSVGEECLPRFAVFDEGMHEMHPEKPHEYLGFVATWPDHQGEGHGTRLLERRHADLDASGVSAYLASASEQARRLYLRLGYVDHGEPMRLPDGARMWPMWRDPQPRG